jgi:hypothetical protein
MLVANSPGRRRSLLSPQSPQLLQHAAPDRGTNFAYQMTTLCPIYTVMRMHLVSEVRYVSTFS